jgi:hypothetical protein
MSEHDKDVIFLAVLICVLAVGQALCERRVRSLAVDVELMRMAPVAAAGKDKS